MNLKNKAQVLLKIQLNWKIQKTHNFLIKHKTRNKILLNEIRPNVAKSKIQSATFQSVVENKAMNKAVGTLKDLR